jgi:hypothetical protein
MKTKAVKDTSQVATERLHSIRRTQRHSEFSMQRSETAFKQWMASLMRLNIPEVM